MKPTSIIARVIALVALGGCTIGTPLVPPPGPGQVGEGEGEGGGAGGEGEGDIGAGGTFCDMQNLFAASCTVCHNGGASSVAFPDLTSPTGLINAPSALHPNQVLVAPGDPAHSFLFTKVNGVASDSSDGLLMPEGSHLSAAQIAGVSTWIAAGASTDCSAPPPPTSIEPGGDISGHIATGGQGYGTSRPSFLPGDASCTTGSWWQLSLNNPGEGTSMMPGRACNECHRSSQDGPIFAWAGTVSASLHDEDQCRGVQGVRVDILDDATGNVVATDTTDLAGNFGIEAAAVALYRVRLTLDGRTREMITAQSEGDCMTCHTQAGATGAPGRIVAP